MSAILPPPRAVGYVRVSTEEQADEGLSPEVQEARLRAYFAMRGIPVAEVIVDLGVSAGIPIYARPGGARLLASIEAGETQHIGAIRLDRLFRNTADCLTVTTAWDKAGVAMHLVDLGGQTLDTRSAIGRFFLTVMAGAAELERNLTGERVTETNTYLRAHGVYVRRRAPYGYQLAGEGRAVRLVPLPGQAEVVRRIFAGYAAGRGASELVRELADTPGPNGATWSTGTVCRMLRNPAYIGHVVRWPTKHRAEDLGPAVNVEPLVDAETWGRVQERLADSAKVNPKARRSPGWASGVLVCGACGAVMRQWGTGRTTGRYYRCPAASLHHTCDQPAAHDGRLWGELEPLLVARLDVARVASRAKPKAAADRAARERLGAIDAEVAKLLTAYREAGDLLDVADLRRQLDPLAAERARLGQQLAVAPGALPVLAVRTRRELVRQVAMLEPAERGELVRSMVVAVPVRDGRVVAEGIQWRIGV